MKHLIPINLLLMALYLGACFGTYWTLNGCDLYPGTKCIDADLSNQTIVWTDLTGADFTGTKFINAKLDNTIFKNAILDNTNFKGATVTGTDFSGASCKNIRWIDGTLWADGAAPGGPCASSLCRTLFGFDEDASFTTKEVVIKYRSLAIELHPDKATDNSKGNDKKFIELGNCKDVLLLQASDYKSTPPPTPSSACPIKKGDTCADIFSGYRSSVSKVRRRAISLSLVCHVDKTGDAAPSAYLNCCYADYKANLESDGSGCKW